MPNLPNVLADKSPQESGQVVTGTQCYPSTVKPPRRIEDLDPPYSAYPAIALTFTTHPETGKYGLGIRHVRPYARWLLEKWGNWNTNDYYALYINNLTSTVASAVVKEDLPRYGLSVPETHVPEGEVQIYARVLRAGTFQESTSPLQTILIKTTRPGGIDQDPGIPHHTGLTMTIEDLPEGSIINAPIAAVGVWCLINRYQYIRKNDKIEVSWDGIPVTHVVSPEEAAGTGPIRVFIDPSIISKGSQLGILTIRFRVQDVLENFSGEKFQYSKAYLLDSELDESLLPAPIFLVDDEETNQIDFDKQSGAIFEIVVITHRILPAPTPRNKIIITLIATLADGSIQSVVLPPVTDRNLGTEFVIISKDIIEPLVGGSFRLSFEWQTASGSFLAKSGSTAVIVIGTQVLMPGVTITPIELGLIDPDSDIEVEIPIYEPHNADWLETLVAELRLPDGGGETYTEAQLAGVQGGSRRITKEDLQRFKGLGMVYFYYLVNDGNVIRKSEEVGALVGERVVDMPVAYLQGMQGVNINPGDVVGPTVLLTLPYTGTLDGDVIQWNCVGSAVGGSASGTIIVNAGTAGQVLVLPVNRDILDRNFNGSLRITYSLERSGPPRLILRSEVLTLSVGIALELYVPEVVEAQRFPDQLDPLAALNGATVKVRYEPMLATDQITVEWLTADGIGNDTKQVQGNPGSNEVQVTFLAQTIAKSIRNDGNWIRVRYHFSRGVLHYEAEIPNLLLKPLTGLPTPTVDGIGDNKIMDITLLDDAARTRISPWSFISANQRIWMLWTGTFDDESPYSEETYTANLVTDEGVINGINPTTPVDRLRSLKDGSVLTIQFWATLTESLNKNSAVLFGVRDYLIQTIPPTLPAPKFADQEGPILSIYPLDYKNSAWVTVAYPSMNTTHLIQVEWIFPDASMASIAPKNGLNDGRVDFPISLDILADSVGKTITLRYIATINGHPVESETQTLVFDTINASDLPPILINGIPSGGTLDLNFFSGNATINSDPWPLSKAGQRVWLTCRSSGVQPLNILTAYRINPSEALNGLAPKDVLRNWLEILPTNSEITVTCEVTFDTTDIRSRAVPFNLTYYTVRERRTRDYTNFENGLNNWTLGAAGRDMYIRGTVGNKSLFNNTHDGPPANGIVISKEIDSSIGGDYKFTVRARRTILHGETPKLVLEINGSRSARFTLADLNYWNLVYSHTASSTRTRFVIHSEEASREGNDYEFDYLLIE